MATTGSTPGSPAAPPATAAEGSRGLRSSRAVQVALARPELSIAVVAIGLYIYFLNTAVDFATEANLRTLGTFVAATAIIAFGEVFLMISGEIDLSVGQVFALAAFIVYWLA